jgi:hypothetical protein
MQRSVLLVLLIALFAVVHSASILESTRCIGCVSSCLTAKGSLRACYRECISASCNVVEIASDSNQRYDNSLTVPAASIRGLHGKEKPSFDVSRSGESDIYFPDRPSHIHVGGRWNAGKTHFDVAFVSFKVNGIGPQSPSAEFRAAYPQGRNLRQRADSKFDTSKLPAVLAKEKDMLIAAQIGY